MIKSGSVFRGIIKNRKKSGKPYWVDATITPIYYRDGRFAKYIGARYHITDEEVALNLYNAQAKKMGLPVL